MTQYCIRRLSTQIIEGGVGRPDPEGFIGPIDEPPEYPDEFDLIPYQGNLLLGGSPTPSAVLRWSGTAPAWVDESTLDDLKARKSEEINAARFAANQSYFEFDGRQIACDSISMLDIQCTNAEVALTQSMPANWPGAWKALDNSYPLIPDVATWTVFIKAMVSRGTAHFEHSKVLKEQIAAAETPAEIAAITW